jgi:tetratricopeptide (TPR) repeat protein
MSAVVVAAVLSSMTISSLSGCKAIRERRAEREAQREAERRNERYETENPESQQANRDWLVGEQTNETQIESQAEPVATQPPAAEPSAEQVRAEPDRTETEEAVVDSTQQSQPEPEPVQEVATEQREQNTESDRPMQVVDDRPSAADNGGAKSDDPDIDIIEPDRRVFSKRSKEEVSYDKAVELYASGDLEKALLELERAIAFNPQFTRAYLESGDIYLELADYEKAERQFALAVRTEPRNYIAQYRHGQVLHRLGQLEKANRAYLRALSIRPADFDANIGISIVLLEMGKAEQSLPYGLRAVRSEPPSGRARMHLGNVFAAVDRHSEAVIEYQQAAELMDVPTAGLLLNMAESLNQLERYAEMVGALDQLVRIEPDAIAYERLGSGLFRLRRYEESLEAFTRASELEPDYFQAFNGIAVCELNQYLWSSKTDGGARERAVKAMRVSLRIQRDQPRIVELLRRYSSAAGSER